MYKKIKMILSEEIMTQIEVDIPRTFPSELSPIKQKELKNLLIIIAINYPEVFYIKLDRLCTRNELYWWISIIDDGL